MNDKNQDIKARNVRKTSISDEMEDSYLSYAMSVIAGRALPDVRDGLKPVQRRLIFSMKEENLKSTKSHRKCSNIVGYCMGNYHPHGDKAIYDALTRMAQSFSMNKPLVDGQGNFGSIDGDPPAAMRYTEARMSDIASELVKDLDKDTVDFEPNYDDRKEEPKVLPTRFPNLLVNGTSGIAVGLSTNIPPHNLNDVIKATTSYIENPNIEIEDLIEDIKGPDLPTGGEIIGEGYKEAYRTGKGSFKIRAKYDKNREDDQIIVKEIPYKKDKSDLIEEIADLISNDRIEGISNVRDHSNKDGIRIVIDIKNGYNIDVIENKLIDLALEKNMTVLNLALVDGTPKLLTLKDFLREFVEHRKEIIRRKSEYQLEKKKNKLHITRGKLKAVDKSEEVVDLIKSTETKSIASKKLQEGYDLTEKQAESILRLQLGSLTGMKIEELEKTEKDLEENIEELKNLLNSEQKIRDKIKKELKEIKKEYGEERKTELLESQELLTERDLIPEKENIVMLTEENYIKRTPIEDYKVQHRAGKGVKISNLNKGDSPEKIIKGHSHNNYIMMNQEGEFYYIHGTEIPEKKRTSKPVHVNDIIPAEKEDICEIVQVREEPEADYLISLTENGLVKKTEIEEYMTKYARNRGLNGLEIEDNDNLIGIEKVNKDDTIMITTKNGKVIRFSEEDVRAVSRNSKGVRGISLEDTDKATSITSVKEDSNLLISSREGKILKSKGNEFSIQSRGGKGCGGMKEATIVDIDAIKGEGNRIAVYNSKNIIIFPDQEVKKVKRNSKGVKAMEADSKIKGIFTYNKE